MEGQNGVHRLDVFVPPLPTLVWSKVPLRIDLACRTGRYPNDGIGASCPLQGIPAIVSFLNSSPALSLGDGN